MCTRVHQDELLRKLLNSLNEAKKLAKKGEPGSFSFNLDTIDENISPANMEPIETLRLILISYEYPSF